MKFVGLRDGTLLGRLILAVLTDRAEQIAAGLHRHRVRLDRVRRDGRHVRELQNRRPRPPCPRRRRREVLTRDRVVVRKVCAGKQEPVNDRARIPARLRPGWDHLDEPSLLATILGHRGGGDHATVRHSRAGAYQRDGKTGARDGEGPPHRHPGAAALRKETRHGRGEHRVRTCGHGGRGALARRRCSHGGRGRPGVRTRRRSKRGGASLATFSHRRSLPCG